MHVIIILYDYRIFKISIPLSLFILQICFSWIYTNYNCRSAPRVIYGILPLIFLQTTQVNFLAFALLRITHVLHCVYSLPKVYYAKTWYDRLSLPIGRQCSSSSFLPVFTCASPPRLCILVGTVCLWHYYSCTAAYRSQSDRLYVSKIILNR